MKIIEYTNKEKNQLKYWIPMLSVGIFLIVTGFTDTFDDVFYYLFPETEAHTDMLIEENKYVVNLKDSVGTKDGISLLR